MRMTEPTKRLRPATLLGALAFLLAMAAAFSACKNPLAEEAKIIQTEKASPKLVLSIADGTAKTTGGSLDFGTLGIGDARSLVLTIANTGKSALTIAPGAVSIVAGSGTEASIFSIAQQPGASIAAGGSSTMTVSASALAIGAKTATLSITSNDFAVPTFSLTCQTTVTSAPIAPTGLTAVAGISQTTLTWATVPGATSYNLYWATYTGITTANNKIINVVNPYAHLNLTIGSTYAYVVTAVNADGESATSAEASATVLGAAPNAPTGVSASAGDGTATVTWEAAPTAATYTVYWSTSSSVSTASATKAAGISGLSFTHAGLANGSTYYYIVTAVNSGGESMASGKTSAFPEAPAPGAPTGLSGVANPAKVVLSWNEVSGAASYNIYWSTVPGSKTSGMAIAGLTSTTYTFSGNNGTTYYYVVTCVTGGVESAASSQIGVTPQGPPGWPTLTTLTPSIGKVALAWELPSVGTTDSYNVYTSTDAGISKTSGANKYTNITDLTYVHASPSAGVVNYYLVTALNSGGESVVSNVKSILANPDAPTWANATTGEKQLTIDWTAPLNETISGYEVYGSTSADFTASEANKLGSTTTATTFTHSGLGQGVTWYYVVKSVNASGFSPASVQVHATTIIPTVTFDLNDPLPAVAPGTGTMAAQGIAVGAAAALTGNAYVKSGYTFTGWATSSTGAVSFADGVSYTMGAASTTLYAVWSLDAAYYDIGGATGKASYWDIQKWQP